MIDQKWLKLLQRRAIDWCIIFARLYAAFERKGEFDMVHVSEDKREQERRQNMRTAPKPVQILSNWVVEEIEKIKNTPIDDGGLLIEGAPLTDQDLKRCIPLFHAKILRACPPGMAVPKEDAIRAWRVAKIKTIPTKYLPAIAAYKGETPEMVERWLQGRTTVSNKDVSPITIEQILACDEDQLMWLVSTAATRLKDVAAQRRSEEENAKFRSQKSKKA